MEALLQAAGGQDVPGPATCFAALPGCQYLTGVRVGGQIEVGQPHSQQSPGSCAAEERALWGRGEPGGSPCTAAGLWGTFGSSLHAQELPFQNYIMYRHILRKLIWIN